MGFFQGFQHQGLLCGVEPLQKGPLELLFPVAAGHIDLFHGEGVQPRVVHAGGNGAGGGVEILHLPGPDAPFFQIQGQLHRVPQGAAGMGGHEVGHQILLLAQCAVHGLVFLTESLEYLGPGLPHFIQHRVDAVLRGHLQLPADVVFRQLPQEIVLFLRQHIVEADAAADKDLLHPGDGPELPQQGDIVRMVRVQIGAGLRRETAAVRAEAQLFLFQAAGMAEIGRGPSNIVDIALEQGVPGHGLRLRDDAFMAAGGDVPSLVEGQGAEIAAPEAAPVVDDAEAHLLDGGHAPQGVVHGMGLPGEGQGRQGVQLRRLQRRGGGIHHQPALVVLLQKGPAPDGVMLPVLLPAGFRVGPLVLPHLLKGGYLQKLEGARPLLPEAGGAPDVRQLPHLFPGPEPPGDLQAGPLPHAVGQQVRAGIHQHAAAHLVVPIVIVGEAAQGGFQPSHDHGQAGKGLPHPARVGDDRPIGPQARLLAGAVKILAPAALGRRIVGHHAVQVPRGEHAAEPGPPHGPDGRGVVPVRLGQDGHPVARRFQQPPDHRRPEGGMVHIGVPRDEKDVVILPAAGGHILPADGQEAAVHRGFSIT